MASPSHFIFAATRSMVSEGQSNLVRSALAREEEKKAAEELKSQASPEEGTMGSLSRLQSAKRTRRDAGEQAFAAQKER